MIQTLYLVRHGDRSWDLAKGVTPFGTPGDVALTQLGRKQSKELALFFVEEQLPLDAIVCSPFYRALETAEDLAESLQLDILVETGVQETILPDGLHPRLELSVAAIRRFPRIDQTYSPVYTIPDAVTKETHAEHLARAQKVWSLLDQRFSNDPNLKEATHVMIVAHAGILWALGKTLTQDPELPIILCTATTNKFVRQGETDKFDYVWKNEASYLSNGPQNGWTCDGKV